MTKHSSQRIIIVGATSGIGREVALLLLKEGHQLGLAGRRKNNSRSCRSWLRIAFASAALISAGKKLQTSWTNSSENWEVWIFTCTAPVSVIRTTDFLRTSNWTHSKPTVPVLPEWLQLLSVTLPVRKRTYCRNQFHCRH